MNIISAVDNNWAIGNEGKLLFYIPEDMKRFKKLTENNIVIMGRKTLDSLPGGKPLKNRINIVLTRHEDYVKENLIVANSIKELEDILYSINGDGDREEFLIGGGNLINQLVDKCDYAYITKVFHGVKNSDTKIPNLDGRENWYLVEESEENTYQDLRYKYVKYRRK